MLKVLIFTVTAGTAFAGLDGIDWYSDENYVSATGRSRVTSETKFCSKFSGELECKDIEHDPEYYLVECHRQRRVCEVIFAKLMSSRERSRFPNGEPYLFKHEYQITQWTNGRVSADFPHACAATTLQIDVLSKEVFFTITYTKTLKGDPFCIQENLGHTTTYKLEKY